MIDLQLYRLRIGGFSASGLKRTSRIKHFNYDSEVRHFRDTKVSNKMFVFNVIIYSLLVVLALSLLILSYCNNHIFTSGGRDWTFQYRGNGIVKGLPFLSLVYIKQLT